jgi:hypothetical protein
VNGCAPRDSLDVKNVRDIRVIERSLAIGRDVLSAPG